MRLRRPRFIAQGVMVAATVAMCLTGFDGRTCPGGGADPVADDLDSRSPGDLLWLAREANRAGQYAEAARHARAAARRTGVGPELLSPAWMNVFYAAHRTGDREAAATALKRGFPRAGK